MKRVLFVDDNESVIQLYRKAFSRKTDEWQCFYAIDVMDAIDILAFAQIDIVITDLDMPLYNGAQLLTYVQEHKPGITRIVFSGSHNMKQNMKTVNCAHRFIAKPNTIADIEEVVEKIYYLYRTLIDSKTRTIISGIQNLPALPSVYLNLIDEFSNPNYSIKTIAELISSDVGLTVGILKMVNSAYFGMNEPVSSATQAVTLLGGELVKGLILTAHLSRTFTTEEQKFSIEKWEDHSLLTGVFCRAIAEYENMSPEHVEIAFVSGILHDVGRIILATSFPEKYHRVLSISKATKRPLEEIEKSVIGATHSAVGAFLLGLWGLPDIIVETTATHHHPDLFHGAGEEFVRILHLADLFTYEMVPTFDEIGVGYSASQESDANSAQMWDNWRNHCMKVAVEKGYLESEENSVSDLEFTSLEDGNVQSDFMHGYDE